MGILFKRLFLMLFTAIDLASAVTPEVMIPILANKDIQENLIPHLPEGESLPKSEEELRKTVQSPQFQQVRGSGFSKIPFYLTWQGEVVHLFSSDIQFATQLTLVILKGISLFNSYLYTDDQNSFIQGYP